MRALFALGALLTMAGCVSREQLPAPVLPLSETEDADFRATPPAPYDEEAFEPPDVTIGSLESGLTVVHLRLPGSPVAALRYVTRAGGEQAGAADAGIAWLTGQVLTRSTASAASPVSHLLERHGIQPRVEVTRQGASVSLRTRADRLSESAALLAQIIREPLFAQEQVDLILRDTLLFVADLSGTPERRAWLHGKQMLHGTGSRRAMPIWGSKAALQAATRDRLIAHHARTWGPTTSALIVVADIEPEAALALARDTFGTWNPPWSGAGEPPPAAVADPVAQPAASPRVLIIPSRSERATILLLERAPGWQADEMVPFSLLARLLGGMFSTRLNLTLREERGYSYGVNADYEAHPNWGELFLVAQVTQQRVGEAVGAILDELRRLREQGPADGELGAARAQMRESLAAGLERSGPAAAWMEHLFLLEREPDTLSMLVAALETATVAQVRQTAERWLRPDQAPIVVTGNPRIIGPQLEAIFPGRVAVQRAR